MTKQIYRHTRVFNDPDNMHLYPAISWKFIPVSEGMYIANTTICNPEWDTFDKKEARRILNGPSAITFTFDCKDGENLVEQAIDYLRVNPASVARTLVKRYDEIQQSMIDIVIDEMTQQIRDQYQGMKGKRHIWTV